MMQKNDYKRLCSGLTIVVVGTQAILMAAFKTCLSNHTNRMNSWRLEN
jgi:hypothetical protein